MKYLLLASHEEEKWDALSKSEKENERGRKE
jgi:hypothetical protein